MNFTLKHRKLKGMHVYWQDNLNWKIQERDTLSACSHLSFISPIVTKDQPGKLALDYNFMKKTIHKNKYQMYSKKFLLTHSHKA